MTEELNLLYQYIEDFLTAIDEDLAGGKISPAEHRSKKAELLSRYAVAEGMSEERAFLEWKIDNPDISEDKKENARRRLAEIDSDSAEDIIGAEVKSVEYGLGTIVSQKEDFVAISFVNRETPLTYRLDTALKARSIRFTDNNIQKKYEKKARPAEGLNKEFDKKTTEEMKTLNDYLHYVKAAFDCSLGKCLYGLTLVIHCDDDLEYYNSLSAIYFSIFTGGEKRRISQHALVLGAKRWDSSVENMFKQISDNNDGVVSIDISNFSAVDPLFTELIQTINSVDSRKIFAIRIKNNDNSTAGLIASKIPVFEIRHTPQSLNAYAEKLYSLFPARLKGNFSDMKDTLKNIVSAEMREGSFTGEKSLGYIAMNLADFVHKTYSGTNIKIDGSVLYKFYRSSYKSESEKESALDKLRNMTGFGNVLNLAERLVAESYMEKTFCQYGFESSAKPPRHITFCGPAGCGKTTGARLLAQALSEAGIAHGFFELNGRAICGRYLGETRVNVQTAIKAASGGVLFIDEAYALSIGDEFGMEAVSTLLTEMENNNLIIIFAGYRDEMEQFLNSNPGLKSRIGYNIDFKGYNREELFDIAMGFLEKYVVEPDAKALIKQHFDGIPQSTLETPNFGLARYSRNISAAISSASARRHWLADDSALDINAEDVKNALSELSEKERPKSKIGFMI